MGVRTEIASGDRDRACACLSLKLQTGELPSLLAHKSMKYPAPRELLALAQWDVGSSLLGTGTGWDPTQGAGGRRMGSQVVQAKRK